MKAPDTLPILPFMDVLCGSRYAGLTFAEVLRHTEKSPEAMFKALKELRPWNGVIRPKSPSEVTRVNFYPRQVLFPGKELPDDYVWQFDEKKIIQIEDHACITGNVPATMLATGEPREVIEYTKKMMDFVGDGGGFILSTGCSFPPDAKPENIKL